MVKDDDDDEAARRAFTAFMVGDGGNNICSEASVVSPLASPGGGSKKKKKKKKGRGARAGVPPATVKSPPVTRLPLDRPAAAIQHMQLSSTTSSSRNELVHVKNIERLHWRMHRAFFAIVKDEWLVADDQLEAVIASIDNMRGRFPIETKVLESIRADEEQEAKKPWDGYGLGYSTRREHNFVLTAEDVKLAMGHDLQQHEKMLSACRTLMANLSETQDALGRKLDEMVSSYVQSSNDDFHMLSSALKEDTSSNSIPAQTLLEETTHVYNMLSLELFRKQSLSQLLFDSMTNDVLTGPKEPIKDAVVSGGEEDESKFSSKKASSMCSKEWSRRSRYSSIDIDALNRALRRCDRKTEKLKGLAVI